jgi:hypothetical protein
MINLKKQDPDQVQQDQNETDHFGQLPFNRLKVYECKQYSPSDHTEQTIKCEFYESRSIGRYLTELGNALFVYWNKR